MNALTSMDFPVPPGPRLLARGRVSGEAVRYAALERENGTVELDMHAVWTAIRRNLLFIGITVALALVLGVASILLTTPKYRAVSSVQVDAQSAKVLATDNLEPVVDGTETERFIRTQMDILTSRSLATSVAQSQGLMKDEDFLPQSDVRSDRSQEVVDKVLKRLEVEMLPNSRIIQISFDDTDPKRAARIADAFADKLIKSNLQRKYATSSYSREFLGGQLDEAKRKLEDAERAVISYARSAHLLDASDGATRSNTDAAGTKSLTTASLVGLNDSYSAARAARIQAQQRWEQAQKVDPLTLPEVLGNPAIQQLTQNRAELRVQYKEERQHRKVDHPVVKQLQAKITEINKQITGLAGTIRNSIGDQYKIAQHQESALHGDVEKLTDATLAEQDRSVQYNILKREADTSRQMYDALLQRFKEISAASGITTNNITVIDRAIAPNKPVSPNVLINMAAALLGGLAMALIGIFARERFVDRIRDADDVHRKLTYPVLGVVPKLVDQQKPREALANPRSSFSEAHHSICTALEFASVDGLPRTLMLTSSRPGEGKSTTAVSFATSLAELGKQVLLIDADMRRPSLHTVLKKKNDLGLVHLLTRKRTLEQVAQTTDVPGVLFVGTGPLPPSPSSLLSGNALRTILEEISDAFDVIIVDAPPVLGLADAPRISSVVDATVFVLEANGAQARTVERALQRLDESRARIAGLVLTKYDGGARANSDYNYGYGEFDRPEEAKGAHAKLDVAPSNSKPSRSAQVATDEKVAA